MHLTKNLLNTRWILYSLFRLYMNIAAIVMRRTFVSLLICELVGFGFWIYYRLFHIVLYCSPTIWHYLIAVILVALPGVSFGVSLYLVILFPFQLVARKASHFSTLKTLIIHRLSIVFTAGLLLYYFGPSSNSSYFIYGYFCHTVLLEDSNLIMQLSQIYLGSLPLKFVSFHLENWIYSYLHLSIRQTAYLVISFIFVIPTLFPIIYKTWVSKNQK